MTSTFLTFSTICIPSHYLVHPMKHIIPKVTIEVPTFEALDTSHIWALGTLRGRTLRGLDSEGPWLVAWAFR